MEDKALEQKILPREILLYGFEPSCKHIEAKAYTGDVLFYFRNTLHSSSINRSQIPRVAMQALIHLNGTGEAHCRDGILPRTVIERNYDRHFNDYHLFNYFGCEQENIEFKKER